jgi:hypothetical protein
MSGNREFAKTPVDSYETAMIGSYWTIRNLIETFANLEEIVFMAPDYSEEEVARLRVRLDEGHDKLQGVLDSHPNPKNSALGIVARMPVFSVLPFKSTAKGVAKMEKELVARRLSARSG